MRLKSIVRTVSVSLLFLLAGCALLDSWDDASRSWVGSRVDKYISLNGPPSEVRQMDAGLREFRFDLRKLDPSCVHYWLVDESGIIVDYRYKGYCRLIG
jgi:hypothetical protein